MKTFSKITIALCVFLAVMLFAVGPVSALVQMENIDSVTELTFEYQQYQDLSIEEVVGTGTVADAPTESETDDLADDSADDSADNSADNSANNSADDLAPDLADNSAPDSVVPLPEYSQKPIPDFTMQRDGEYADGFGAIFIDKSQFANYVLIDFGDGGRPQCYTILNDNYKITHTYPLSMTHTYKVTYTASNQNGQSSKVATIYV